MNHSHEITALKAATQTYFDGLYDGDADKIASVFLQTSALTQSFENKLVVTPRDTWLDVIRNRPSPRSQGLERGDHIVAIDLVSENLALVKVKCQLPPRYFTDFLSFVKLDGQWKIAQKVFTTQTEA